MVAKVWCGLEGTRFPLVFLWLKSTQLSSQIALTDTTKMVLPCAHAHTHTHTHARALPGTHLSWSYGESPFSITTIFYADIHAQSLQSCPALCDLMDYRPPSFSVHGILQARILEWVAMPSSRRSSQPRDQTCISCIFCIAGRFFTAEPLGKPIGIYTLAYLFLFWFPCQDISFTRTGTLSTVPSPMPNIS